MSTSSVESYISFDLDVAELLENDVYDSKDVDNCNQDNLIQLKKMCENINWDIKKERYELMKQLEPLCRSWKGQLPDFRGIFHPEQMDWLLKKITVFSESYRFVDFVIRTGYVDEPGVDDDGKPLLRRTTALHLASGRYFIDKLFKIYKRFDANYTDEFGISHFHVACQYGCDDIVEKFLELGQDPNFLAHHTGDSPLHLSLRYDNKKVVELLLRRGADPNLANEEGLTPLHVICNRYYNDKLTELFLKINEDMQQTVEVNARDKLGRTPLVLAVANFMSQTIDVLLDHGADLSGFVFPTESDFKKYFQLPIMEILGSKIKLRVTSGPLFIIERLEKRGYELDRSGALTVMKLFANYEAFEKSGDLDEFWHHDEELTTHMKAIRINSSLSLYDLMQLRPEEAVKLVSHTDYYEFAFNGAMWKLPENSFRPHEAFVTHLGEKLSKRFFRRWALDPFMVLTRYRLPILCCDMIIKRLKNEDLYHICLATTA